MPERADKRRRRVAGVDGLRREALVGGPSDHRVSGGSPTNAAVLRMVPRQCPLDPGHPKQGHPNLRLPTDGRQRLGLLVVFALAVMFQEGVALGHVVNVFAVVEGKTIRGEVYFRGGTAAQAAKVEAFDPRGRKLAETTTDREGKFSLPVRVRCDHRLLAQAGEGHAGQYTIVAAELPEQLPPPDGQPGTPEPGRSSPAASPAPSDASAPARDARVKHPSEATVRQQVIALSQQVIALRRQLDRFENTLRIRDVLGGIGYILGIMGLLFFFLGRRRGPHGK